MHYTYTEKMHYTYILQSQQDQNRFYIGYTSDLKCRLTEHNFGKSIHTKKFPPWKIKNYIAFEDATRAAEFGKFLKSGNGRNFIKKHFFSRENQRIFVDDVAEANACRPLFF